MVARRQHFDDDHTEEQKKSDQISLHVSPQLGKRIKAAAEKNKQTVEEYLNTIFPEEGIITPAQQELSADEAIERLLQLHEQVMKESNGKLFEDSTEVIRQMREERTAYLEEQHKL